MFARRYIAILILIAAAGVGYFVYATEKPNNPFAFKLGLDLSGGTHLVYSADVSKVTPGEEQEALAALQTVIERRVNAFGVGEPVVQTQQGGALGTGEHRLIVELPGVTDVDEAIKMIGETPLLEFKLVREGMEASTTDALGNVNPAAFTDTGLTGQYVSRSALEFSTGAAGIAGTPLVRVDFNAEGAKLFSDITTANVGKQVAIFLDGALISAPVVQEPITDGIAIISGNFTAEGAKELVRNLNLGALPVPIELKSTQTIGASLGEEALKAGVVAGIVGFILLSIFMIFWYRLPGVIAVVSLLIYVIIMLALFKFGVVLTAAGLAGLILSIGLAVDANVLIAERMKEELAEGKSAENGIKEGFARAWLAIRDSNIAHIIAGIILFWFGTSLIKGFALVFGLGVFVSMLSAIVISRSFLLAIGLNEKTKLGHFLMRSGFRK